jgi:hypothetical protein
MKKTTILLIGFWCFAAVIIAWLLPFMARNNDALTDFLSYCISFIQ